MGIDKFAADVYNPVTGEDKDGGDGRRNRERNNKGDVELPSGFYGDVDTSTEETENESNAGLKRIHRITILLIEMK